MTDTQTEANPNLRRFHNRLRILLGIDMSELVNAGAISSDDTASWTSFRDNPWRWFIKAGDAEQAAIWSIIERREGGAAASAPKPATGPVNCTHVLRREGKAYPRTCALGPCPFYNNDGTEKP